MYKTHYSISWKCSLLLHILPWYFCEKVYCHTGKLCLGNTTSLKFEILSPLHKVYVGQPRRMFVYYSIVCFLSSFSSLSMCVHSRANTHTHTKLMTLVSLLSFSCRSTLHIFSLQEHCFKVYLTWHCIEII
jgi:hypothetical protein